MSGSFVSESPRRRSTSATATSPTLGTQDTCGSSLADAQLEICPELQKADTTVTPTDESQMLQPPRHPARRRSWRHSLTHALTPPEGWRRSLPQVLHPDLPAWPSGVDEFVAPPAPAAVTGDVPYWSLQVCAWGPLQPRRHERAPHLSQFLNPPSPPPTPNRWTTSPPPHALYAGSNQPLMPPPPPPPPPCLWL